MIKLCTLEGKMIRLTDKEGQIFEGIVGDYIHPEDNVPEEVEAIIMDYPLKEDGAKSRDLLEFTAVDIASFEVLE